MTEYVTVTSDAPDARTGAIKLHGPAAFEGMMKAGRLAAGRLADLLVVDGDVAADVTALGRPTSVWVGGVAVDLPRS